MSPVGEPRIRVSALLHWRDRILLCRHEKPGKEYWLLPGGGVNSGESLVEALRRELAEEIGIDDVIPFEGPIAVVDSIAPAHSLARKHVVHIIFSGDLGARSLETVTSADAAVRGHRLFALGELDEVVLHPPIQRFVARWRPGDPTVYLGPLWAP
jgi:8-oxo-dGTP diphosphatase